ncbi:hypothetical protein I4U23_010477 [Adineta vaga]|nr:hypothetical protein I4U23_010477 [Adineta vaga]
MTIRQFKERLYKELDIPVDQQSLIFKGKVLGDNMKFTDIDAQNSTIHVIERINSIPSSTENVATSTVTVGAFASASKDDDLATAEDFTKKLLGDLPPGDSVNKSTLYHVINKLIGNKNQPCLFYDSSKGMRLHDTTIHLTDINCEDKPIVLTLKSFYGLRGYENSRNDVELIQLLNKYIKNNYLHPILDDILERLSKAHSIAKSQVSIKQIFLGSTNVVYTVSCLTEDFVNQLQDLSDRLREEFDEFESARIHPLLYRPSFDINCFDERGDKCYGQTQASFQVGPPQREKTYKTPVGWTRFGLKVLDKYEDRTWLHPFHDPGNWYRAFHGTGRVTSADFNNTAATSNSEFAPVDAMASIFRNGFRVARIAAYGPGVYCSPDPAFSENGYVGIVTILTQQGEKRFKCMLQVAVNPDGLETTSHSGIWVVPEPENIRPYGILIKKAEGNVLLPEDIPDPFIIVRSAFQWLFS